MRSPGRDPAVSAPLLEVHCPAEARRPDGATPPPPRDRDAISWMPAWHGEDAAPVRMECSFHLGSTRRKLGARSNGAQAQAEVAHGQSSFGGDPASTAGGFGVRPGVHVRGARPGREVQPADGPQLPGRGRRGHGTASGPDFGAGPAGARGATQRRRAVHRRVISTPGRRHVAQPVSDRGNVARHSQTSTSGASSWFRHGVRTNTRSSSFGRCGPGCAQRTSGRASRCDSATEARARNRAFASSGHWAS